MQHTSLIQQKSKETEISEKFEFRPSGFDDFVGQQEIKKILKVAVESSLKSWRPLGHTLLSGESWFWKTTLAQIIASARGVNIKIVTAYAISKPAEMISLLNWLKSWDILFIDEIHRLKANVEEVLYIAMEDFVVDMVVDGWDVRIPLAPFTLIWATTKMESLTAPFKNRFVYKFHFLDYWEKEKINIIKKYINLYGLETDEKILQKMSEKVVSVPREIHNFAIRVKDYMLAHNMWKKIDENVWNQFSNWWNIKDWGLDFIHQKYLEILRSYSWKPVGLKTIAYKLWINEKSVESDIEPLLFKLGLIDKTSKWRIIL